MKVKCTQRGMASFTYGTTYDVIGVDQSSYKLKNDMGIIASFSKANFIQIPSIDKEVKKLTKEQKDFLLYVKDNHFSLGWLTTINNVIKNKGYEIGSINHENLIQLTTAWKKYVSKEIWHNYGDPTKYLR